MQFRKTPRPLKEGGRGRRPKGAARRTRPAKAEEWIRQEVAKIVAEARAADKEDNAHSGPIIGRGDSQRAHRRRQPPRRPCRGQGPAGRRRGRTPGRLRTKLAKRREFKQATGQEMVGRKPKPPAARQKDAQRSKKANITDPDSRTMSTANCGYQQGTTPRTFIDSPATIAAIA